MAVLLVDVGFGDLHSTKDPAMDLYIIHMSKLILQSAKKIIVLEIIGLLQADKKVDKKERDFLKRLTAGIGISETNVKNIESLLEEYNDVTNKIFNMILDES